MTAVTAAPRRTRVVQWGALVVALVVIGVIGMLLARPGWTVRAPLDPASAAPEGARAVARILEQQGVTVEIVRDRGAAADALAAGPATLALPDPVGLTDQAVADLVADAQGVVLLEPKSRTLGLLVNGSGFAEAFADAPLAAECALPAARRSGAVTIGELYEPGAGVTACYPAAGGYGLLASGGVVAVDARAILANDVLADEGNAALALGVLGAHPTLVWYLPSPGDADAAPPTLGDLTPPWVTPAILLLLAAGGCAIAWRGRRFGPLVAETLPVTVRAAETTIGRGRLYARSGDVAHAAAQLRTACRDRLAEMLGLGPSTGVAAVADAAAALVGADPAGVRDLLYARIPRTERELVEIDDRLRTLEAAVRSALRPGRRTP